MKYRTVVCKLGRLKKKYELVKKVQMDEMYREVLLEEMQLRIMCLEQLLN